MTLRQHLLHRYSTRFCLLCLKLNYFPKLQTSILLIVSFFLMLFVLVDFENGGSWWSGWGELGSPSRAWIWHDGMNTKETLLSLLLLNGWHEYSDAINNVPWSGLLCCLLLLPFCSPSHLIPHSFSLSHSHCSFDPTLYHSTRKGNVNHILVGNWDFT